MKKLKSKLSVVMAMLLIVASATGCSSSSGTINSSSDDFTQEIDKNKTQITMSIFNGGYGYAWAVNKAKDWSDNNDKYQVIVAPNKDEWYTFSSNLEAGTCQYDIIQNTPDSQAYALGYLEDLRDVLDTPAQGEQVSLKDKVFAQEKLDMFTYSVDQGIYALPLFEGVSGFIYDHEIFLQKKFLIGRDGQLIGSVNEPLSLGRDGIEGTLDDGHPVNMTEYKLMVNAIKDSGMYTYLWSGKFSYYTQPLLYQLFYDYIGKDAAINVFMGLNGSYTNPKTGEVLNITQENGYEAYKMAGYQESLQWIDDYLANPIYYHPQSAKYSTGHTDAQKVFVYGNAFNGATADKQVAFIYEGNWWENEARANFNSLTERGYIEYSYGTRDYRMMTPPALDEYGVYEDIPLVSFDYLGLCVKKQNDQNKLAAIKDFLAYLYSEESLVDIAVATGGLIPYEIDFDETDYAKMTKFAQNMNLLYRADNAYSLNVKVSGHKNLIKRYQYAIVDSTSSNYGACPIDFFLRGPGLVKKVDASVGYNNLLAYLQNNWGKING